MRRRDAAEAAWARAKATSCALTCYSTTSPASMLVALGRCDNLHVGASAEPIVLLVALERGEVGEEERAAMEIQL